MRCQRCLLRTPVCICADVPRVETRTRLVLVRHICETKKPGNTARFALLALPRAELVEYGQPYGPPLVIPDPDDTWLLFPDDRPDGVPAASPVAHPPKNLLVLDGTWSQARKMSQRIPALRGLRRFSLPAPPAPPARLRRPPRADGMSTLEAIAGALAILEGPEVAAPLLELQAEVVRRSISGHRGADDQPPPQSRTTVRGLVS